MSGHYTERTHTQDRRRFLKTVALASAAGLVGVGSPEGRADDAVTLPFENGERPLIKYPQKRPLIRVTSRPPQLETPFAVFNESVLTPNDAFFVRYHLSEIPLSVNQDTFRVRVQGSVATPLELSLADLKSKFQKSEIVAVNQCSGNGRGFFQPRVAGGQLGNGAMGNARWTGVPLKLILDRAGVSAGARQVTFRGLDSAVNPRTPEFVKALDLDHARDGEVMLAYAMNGADLPMLNGYPLRLVVPGYYGTYWVKHVSEITVVNDVFGGYWMNPAYRIPANACGCVEPGATPTATVPIGRFNVRSFITSHQNGDTIKLDEPTIVKGIAFDGGFGVNEVLFSRDGGQVWQRAELDDDLGKYSFRGWRIVLTANRPGPSTLMARATNRIGQSQPLEPLWNPAGYLRNVVETVKVNVV